MKKKKGKKTFKKINVDAETFGKISHICKALGKKKSQLLREVFEAMSEVCSKDEAVCKIIKNPLRDAVVFIFFANKTYKVNGK
jgi:hypothetical protein